MPYFCNARIILLFLYLMISSSFIFNTNAANQPKTTQQYYQDYLDVFIDSNFPDHEKITLGQTLIFNINEVEHPEIVALSYLQLMHLSAKKSDTDEFDQWQSNLSKINLSEENLKVVNFLSDLYQMQLNTNKGQHIIAISQGKALKAQLTHFDISQKVSLSNGKAFITELDKAKLFNILGVSFFSTSDYEAAQQHFLDAMNIYENEGVLKGKMHIYNNLSMISWAQQNLPQAISLLKKSLKLAKEINDEASFLRGSANLGIYYAGLNKHDNALASYRDVLEHPSIKQYSNIHIQTLISKAETFQAIGDFKNSEQIIQQALLFSTQSNNKVNVNVSKVALADLLTYQGKFEQALVFYLNAISFFKESQLIDYEIKTLLQISELYKKQGNPAKALEYFEQYNERSIEILKNAQKSSIINLHAKYQVQSQQEKIQLLEQKNKLNTIEIAQTVNQKKIIILASVVVIIMMLLLFSRFYMRKKSHRLQQHNEEIKANEKQLLLLSHAFSNTSDAVWITNADFEIEAVNNAYVQHTHKTKREVIGKKVAFANVKGQDSNLANRIMLQAKIEDTWQGELFDMRSEDEIYPLELDVEVIKNEKNEIIHYLGVFRDIAERNKSQDQLTKLATHDELTGLPNRALLDQLIKQSCLNAKHTKKSPTLLLLDVNGFKKINDSFGHSTGDSVICEIANRLKQKLFSKDVVARINGAEFCILAELNDPQRSGARIAQKILSIFEAPFDIDEISIPLTASMGITLYPEDSDNAQGLLKKAAIAMLDVKNGDIHHYRFFEDHMNNEVIEQLEKEQKLLNAIVNQQFEFYYQPVINIETGSITGAEALIRWIEPDGNIISPAQFIPLAEQAGFIDQIDRITINQVFEQVSIWQKEKRQFGAISINLSGKTFSKSEELLTMLKAKLSQFSIQASLIKIEITEGMLLNDIDQAIETMNGIKSLGFQLALDDFGTGFSSLNYLKKFPIDILKVDRSFIMGMHESPTDQSIVRSIISLAHTLNLKVIGEGVELEEHVDELKKMNCEEYQGYAYSKPVPLAAFEALLTTSKSNLTNTSIKQAI
jgi:diguanylate cyclase (GGDEF)-like protein/PAS domain S-box-containing protein